MAERAIQGQLNCDEFFEESIDTETIQWQEKEQRKAFCDQCFIYGNMDVLAFYMCFVCRRYYCKKCFSRHRRLGNFHKFIRVESTEREIAECVSDLMNESEEERKESLRKTNVCVCDFVDTKHGLDKVKDCLISGIIGYEHKWWVVCDYFHSYIKVFRLGSNVLHRYIRLGSEPWDVTEVTVENKTTEQDLASCSETANSGTDNKPDRKHLLAVTFPGERLILIIDLGKTPAVIHNKIKTEKECSSIDFFDGNIYTVCEELRDSPCSISKMSVEGITLKTFKTDVSRYNFPYLSVLNGNIYMTDPGTHKVVCYNDEGQRLHEITIDGSRPVGICVDRSEDKVYICSSMYNNVYELESDLSRYKSVLDHGSRYMEGPEAMCFYSDKLYFSHWSRSRSHVTVVRLL